MSRFGSGSARTRFAPSPTGRLHIGNVRTALFNYLFARASSGSFILRIDDTDKARSTPYFERAIMDDMKWLGLEWDEGPDKAHKNVHYRQSERQGIYKEFAEKLLKGEKAYPCFCARERLEALRKSQLSSGAPPRYDGRCRAMDERSAPTGVSPAIRFMVPERTVSFDDVVHGHLSFEGRTIGDFVIIGSDGIASYNFATAVDDALMSITHIIRGDDHISNTPRQIMLLDSLGLAAPKYAHIPLVLGNDNAPLGKRDASSSIELLREQGFLPQAVINAVARLGWSPPEGFLSADEMSGSFSLDKLSKSPSIFDMERLKSFNRAAIERIGDEEIINLSGINAKGTDAGRVKSAVHAVRRNADTLKDISLLVAPLINAPELSEDSKQILSLPHSQAVIGSFIKEAERETALDNAAYARIMENIRESTNEKGKRLYMPIRCGLTGRTVGIELVHVVTLLGKDEVINRLKKSIEG
ncbi:MAG: glutamate--tRNA ligase [Deltaproteobacteria bacterium]|nr:glutamate--tRNA ligase [Deltaproteobacteria bacterium]